MLNLAHLPDVSGMEQDMMSAALVYAETGFPVFPCRNKKPITDHGHKDATTDEAIIRKWWTRNPDAQIGTPTGPASGVWALDEDLPDGPDTLEQLIDTYGPLPPTRTQQTGSGGKQFLFSWNGCQVRNSTSKIGPDIDVRGDGGYIILPPSGHPSGGVYQWINELSPAAAPDWLSELALNPRRPKTALQDTNAATFQGTAYGRAALEREVERVSTASEGTRNDTLNKAAFALGQLVAGNGLSENDVLTALSNAALENGLEHREVEKTIQSGIEAGKQNPRSISNDGYDRGNNLPSSRESSTGALRDGNDGNDGITEDRTTLTLPPPPLDVFYYDIRKAMENIAETKKPPIEVCVSGILALASGLVGRSRGITIKAGWSERGNLYIGLVGRSSCGKSPAINSIFKPIYEKEKRYQEQYQREMEAYELALQEWRSRKKDAPPEPKPEPPVRIDLVLDDWTIEAAADSLSANPRGVLLYRDELAGMLMDLENTQEKRVPRKPGL
ncbi:Bifunctional DNA primase/polymerase [Desulfonatronospira thiodismutans ASO3-1]|uniref:Bifunctional DNA primase/polymerase n=1 Tax=Desulfonatronospira thiodismutans ASO3-1 TaxID=555779 RepID=D6STR7_9BACT|nr:bifunctional DNA primase/polymerase [Desulfonatronospira thiodismutans]EFI34083.1 Bifunctional DNA primase/polymerase [Desulfonatronospira thiodismutans ASO3-1]